MQYETLELSLSLSPDIARFKDTSNTTQLNIHYVGVERDMRIHYQQNIQLLEGGRIKAEVKILSKIFYSKIIYRLLHGNFRNSHGYHPET
jgi:hypothetical protein